MCPRQPAFHHRHLSRRSAGKIQLETALTEPDHTAGHWSRSNFRWSPLLSRPMPSSRSGSDRRKAQRVRLIRNISGTDQSGQEVKLRDLSREAFSVETQTPYTVGEIVRFRFRPSAEPLILDGRVTRCERSRAAVGTARFLAGFSFAWKTPNDRASAQVQIRALTRSLVARYYPDVLRHSRRRRLLSYAAVENHVGVRLFVGSVQSSSRRADDGSENTTGDLDGTLDLVSSGSWTNWRNGATVRPAPSGARVRDPIRSVRPFGNRSSSGSIDGCDQRPVDRRDA
jgi:hypothetical protein